MNITHVVVGPGEFLNGCFFIRLFLSGQELSRMGHEKRTLFLQSQVNEKWFEWTDVAVFTRWYGENDVLPLVQKFKSNGAKIAYEIDDDLWTVPDVNVSKDVTRRNKMQAEELMGKADLVTTTTDILKKRIEDKVGHGNVRVCPNALDESKYKGSSRKNAKLKIGWSGAASHWEDLLEVLPAIKELQEDYDFEFIIQGICDKPLEAEFYTTILMNNIGVDSGRNKSALEAREVLKDIDFQHIPFYPPEMHSDVLQRMNLDIGLCPLTDNYFNKAKSNIKFYEYALSGATTIASDVKPYNLEVDYVAENTKEDWKDKISQLIDNKEMRKDILEKQQKFVKENRTLKQVVPNTWEKYFRQLIK